MKKQLQGAIMQEINGIIHGMISNDWIMVSHMIVNKFKGLAGPAMKKCYKYWQKNVIVLNIC